MRKDILVAELSSRLPLSWLILQKIIQFGILVFLEAQEINFRGTLKVNVMNIACF